MLHELFITHCTNGTLIMNPFTKKFKVISNECLNMLKELIDLESANQCTTFNDNKRANYNILGKQWLTSNHISSVNKLIVDVGNSLNVFQDTLLVPVLEKKGTWHIPANGFRGQKLSSTNIHYNGQNHWVTSFQYKDGNIYLLNNNLGKRIDKYLNETEISFCPNLWSGKSQIQIKIHYVQQQKNGYVCDLFVIVNMMEFATNRYSGLKQV